MTRLLYQLLLLIGKEASAEALFRIAIRSGVAPELIYVSVAVLSSAVVFLTVRDIRKILGRGMLVRPHSAPPKPFYAKVIWGRLVVEYRTRQNDDQDS